MTHTPGLAPHTLALASPDAAVAAVPCLLGFTPERSLVVIWVGRGRLRLTQRIDLPGDWAADPPRDWLDACLGHAGATVADEAIVLVYAPGHLPARRCIDAMERRLAESGVALVDALHVDGDRWCSYRCDEPCCPPEGREVEIEVAEAVRAAFALEGVAPLASRQELVAQFAPDDFARTGLARRRRGRARPLGERARTARLAGPCAVALRGEPLDEQTMWALVRGLADIRVRDTFLWRLARVEDPRTVLDVLAAAVRAAPAGDVAPVATCAAIAAWLCGDGARAQVALQRATDDDPGYSMADLIDRALQAALPPQEWRAMMAALTERECRMGW